jgi:hypothetical protein
MQNTVQAADTLVNNSRAEKRVCNPFRLTNNVYSRNSDFFIDQVSSHKLYAIYFSMESV